MDNGLFISDFGEISEKVGFDSQLQVVKEGRFAPISALMWGEIGTHNFPFPRACIIFLLCVLQSCAARLEYLDSRLCKSLKGN